MNIKQIGAGGVGFWLSAALSRAGIAHTVYDTDTLEGGMGHRRVPAASPSTAKTELLKGFTLVSMGDEPPQVVNALFTGKEAEEGDLVVDCSDMDLVTRRRIWANARRRGARMLRVSYDGRNGTVVVAEGLPLSDRPGGGYAEVPGLGLSFVAGGLGAMVVQEIARGEAGEHVEFQVSLSDLMPQYHAAIRERAAAHAATA